MKTPMVLLVSAVMLLVGPAVARTLGPAVASTINQTLDSLKRIIDHTNKVNTFLSKDLFVEEVKHLVGGCNSKFFCKVHDVLNKHANFTSLGREERMILRNLNQLNLHQTVKCAVLLKGVNSSGTEIQMPEFMTDLTDCCKQTILNMGKKGNA